VGEVHVETAKEQEEGCAFERREVHNPCLSQAGAPSIRFSRLDEGVPPASLAYRDQEPKAIPSKTEIVLR